MNKKKSNLLLSGMLLIALAGSLYAGFDQKVEKKFSGVTSIKCEFALGDIEVVKSSNEEVHVTVNYSFDDKYFTPDFMVRGKRLVLKEEYDNHYDDNTRGSVSWTISVPDGMEIDFNTGTGDIHISDCNIQFEGNTGTGSITLQNARGEYDLNTGTNDISIVGCEGEFDCNTGTGRVRIEDTVGEINANSGTGSVRADNITLMFGGRFNSGIKDVTVTGPKGDEFDLHVNSGLGTALVDLQGMELDGYLEMKCNVFSGKIVAPVDFDREEKYGSGKNQTLEKSYSKGNDRRRFYIGTGTGKAVLKK